MSEANIAVSKVFLQALKHRIQQIALISDKLDMLAFETRQVSGFLKDAYKNVRLKEKH